MYSGVGRARQAAAKGSADPQTISRSSAWQLGLVALTPLAHTSPFHDEAGSNSVMEPNSGISADVTANAKSTVATYLESSHNARKGMTRVIRMAHSSEKGIDLQAFTMDQQQQLVPIKQVVLNKSTAAAPSQQQQMLAVTEDNDANIYVRIDEEGLMKGTKVTLAHTGEDAGEQVQQHVADHATAQGLGNTFLAASQQKQKLIVKRIGPESTVCVQGDQDYQEVKVLGDFGKTVVP
eukprot:Blabericola_migrator_1__4242@NODE_22_length_22262_cov_139_742014_g19_i0_p12_GENE_NODE_22_length_22262_cov_139_742014_g19_i0NODE_22_length_22262_cov_139_742014_g19_i0_p12_ORF_typecomplete_len236_score48_78_NODE_22_length_22262_cov_139_742014_g19_i081428849